MSSSVSVPLYSTSGPRSSYSRSSSLSSGSGAVGERYLFSYINGEASSEADGRGGTVGGVVDFSAGVF